MNHVHIATAISAAVLQILAAEQETEFSIPIAPLVDGRILLGRERLEERKSPSRIVMVPTVVRYKPANTMSNVSPAFLSNQFSPAQIRALQRPLAVENQTYEFYCWGQHRPAKPELDLNATAYLASVVIRAVQNIAMSSAHIDGTGEWIDQRAREPQRLKAGHEYMFTLSIDAPVLDSSVQYPLQPLTAVPTVTVS